jgi:hypothetical protein
MSIIMYRPAGKVELGTTKQAREDPSRERVANVVDLLIFVRGSRTPG